MLVCLNESPSHVDVSLSPIHSTFHLKIYLTKVRKGNVYLKMFVRYVYHLSERVHSPEDMLDKCFIRLSMSDAGVADSAKMIADLILLYSPWTP